MITDDVKIYKISENFGIIKDIVQGKMTPWMTYIQKLIQKYCSLKWIFGMVQW